MTELKTAIPQEIKDLLKVRVNHDGQSRDTGMWIASVSAYKALHAQQRRVDRAETALIRGMTLCEELQTALAAANERIAELQKLINESLKSSMEGN